MHALQVCQLLCHFLDGDSKKGPLGFNREITIFRNFLIDEFEVTFFFFTGIYDSQAIRHTL